MGNWFYIYGNFTVMEKKIMVMCRANLRLCVLFVSLIYIIQKHSGYNEKLLIVSDEAIGSHTESTMFHGFPVAEHHCTSWKLNTNI